MGGELRIMTTTLFRIAIFSLVLATDALAQMKDQQRVFETPESAAKALATAAKANDENALVEIFGAKHRNFIVTVDKAQDRERRLWFARKVDEYRLLRKEDDNRITLVVGYDAWPFPIPLVKSGAGWRFETDAGTKEILHRRIGSNELAVIEVMQQYGDAQRQYASKSRDGSNVRQFAQKIVSSQGKRDGLYWDADPQKGEELSPIGPLIADARSRTIGAAYNGYYFKILTGQGPAAAAGRYSYVINGYMIAGYALIAFPADYANSGIKTFVVNHYGTVYEKDLGPDTAKLASAMTEYNPDRTWTEVKE
jgi:Protein of unknown function (DUF2950)